MLDTKSEGASSDRNEKPIRTWKSQEIKENEGENEASKAEVTIENNQRRANNINAK